MDGRRPRELRKVACNLGTLQQADGSSYIEQGNTKVLASVYGPHDVSKIFAYIPYSRKYWRELNLAVGP